jgi:hypothetical protein
MNRVEMSTLEAARAINSVAAIKTVPIMARKRIIISPKLVNFTTHRSQCDVGDLVGSPQSIPSYAHEPAPR